MIKQENPYKIYEVDKELEALKGRSNTELIKLYNAGHPRAFTGLIYKNEGLIHLIIYRTRGVHKKSYKDIAEASSDSGLEDLEQIGYIALYSAIGTYDPDKGVKFSSWLSNNIEWDIMRFFRSIKMDKAIRQTSLNRMISNEEDSDIELGELIESDQNVEQDAIDNMFSYELGKIYNKVFRKVLSFAEESVLRLQYGLTATREAYTLDEISEALQIDPEAIQGRRQNAISKLRRRYEIQNIYHESKPPIGYKYYETMMAVK